MKIKSVRIENYRCFKDETIHFDNYTCFIGPNGSGKSTVLNALNVFFRQQKDTKTDCCHLSKADFHHQNTDDPVRITVSFCELSDSAKQDLADYVRQDKLIVTAVAKYDSAIDSAEVIQYGNRLGIDAFRCFFDNEKTGSKVDELKKVFSGIKTKYYELPSPGTKPQMIESLHTYESDHPDLCTLIPSEDQFYGVSKGSNRLSPHIQWVYISALKDITEETEESKNSALGQLLSRTVRSKVNFADKIGELKLRLINEYQSILDSEQNSLDEISKSLQNRLETWSHPGILAYVLWKQDTTKSIRIEEPLAFIKFGERGFEGDLARFGHGLQRSFMLALLQELNTISDETAPTLIMAIEEPEIYQHPPQSRYLSETLNDLSHKNTQVIICSHHPLFIPGDNFEAIRIVREKDNPSFSYISQLKYSDLASLLNNSGNKALKEEGILAKLYPTLNPIINEMFFCNYLILTEGIEDIAYISTYIELMGKTDIFRKYGYHIVPVGGKSNLFKPIAMSRLLRIPTFVIFDADTDNTKPEQISMHKHDNTIILKLLKVKEIIDWPTINIVNNSYVMWKTNIGKEVATDLGSSWSTFKEDSFSYYGQPGDLDKNPLAIARALKTAWDSGNKSSILIEAVKKCLSLHTEP